MNRFQSVLTASTRWFSSARLVGQTTGHPLHRVPYEASARSATQSEAKSTLLASTYPGAAILASVTLGALAEGCASPTEPGAVLTLRLELAEGVQETTIEASLGELNERTIPVTLVDGHISEQCAVYVPLVVSQLTGAETTQEQEQSMQRDQSLSRCRSVAAQALVSSLNSVDGCAAQVAIPGLDESPAVAPSTPRERAPT